MAGPDYNMLFQTPNAGAAFAQAFQQGMQQRQEQQQRNALAALAMNPNDPQAQAAAAQFNPGAVMQARSAQQQQAMQLAEQHRDNILKGAQVIRQIQPKDQASWDQARAIAAQAGIDISEVPAQFDPQYVQGITALADAFAPQAQHNPQIVTTQAGGGVFRIDPATGQAIPLILPNDGSHAPGSPANMPRVTDQASYDAIPPGDQYMDPQGNIRTKGGQSGAGSAGGFPSGGQ